MVGGRGAALACIEGSDEEGPRERVDCLDEVGTASSYLPPEVEVETKDEAEEEEEEGGIVASATTMGEAWEVTGAAEAGYAGCGVMFLLADVD